MMDCKGVASCVYGSILYFLLRDGRLEGNQEARLLRVNDARRQWYRLHPRVVKLPRILMRSCLLEGWAELHGPAIKAANTRNAAKFFKSLAHRYFNTLSTRDRNVCLVADSLVGFYDCLYQSGMLLQNEQLLGLSTRCQKFGLSYQRLRNLAMTDSILAWPVRPKLHKMMHAPEMAEIINPIYVQHYAEESLIGTTAKVWTMSMAGRYQGSLQRVVLTKRLTGLLLRCEGAG